MHMIDELHDPYQIIVAASGQKKEVKLEIGPKATDGYFHGYW